MHRSTSCFVTLVLAFFSTSALAQTGSPTAQQLDILGLKLNMPPAEVVHALQMIGKGHISYHFAEPRFQDGKCALTADDRYSGQAGPATASTVAAPDNATKTYLLPPAGEAPAPSVTCGTFLTDITYFDLAERDGGHTLAAKLLAPGKNDPKLSSDCDSIKVYKPFNNLEAMEASDRIMSNWTTEAMPAQIVACEAIRVMMTPTPGQERSALISRVKIYRSENPSFDAIRKGLESKYGSAPTGVGDDSDARPRVLTQRWTFDKEGRLLPPQQSGGPCHSILGTPGLETTPPVTTTIWSNCAVSLFGRVISLPNNPYLVRSLSVTILNQGGVYRLLKDRAALANRINEVATKAQAAGASAKPEKF